jgi:putative membrane protein
MTLLVIKALHIIFVVTWFAGLFYMFRLFIYHSEASSKPEPAREILMSQYRLMEYRLWYFITWPSAILTLIFGSALLFSNLAFLKQPWMWAKLLLVVLLYMYHLFGERIYKSGKLDSGSYSTFSLRLWNEVATLFLFGIVFLVELQNHISWYWGIGGMIGLGGLMFLAVRKYRKSREMAQWNNSGQQS